YSDCWVEDARLVSLSARDAAIRGADILPRTKVLSARKQGDGWRIETEDTVTQARSHYRAKVLVNAAGPWVGHMIRQEIGLPSSETVRLVRGSHIVTKKLFDHDKCYFFQGTDGRIIFAIPYETDFTLIGTTDVEHEGDPKAAIATEEEQDYLRAFASEYFEKPVEKDDIVWTYSGVRPLYDDGATSATAATRDYVLSFSDEAAPLLNVFGGKITTHRKLAEEAVAKLAKAFPHVGDAWTAGVALPGGDFDVAAFDALVETLAKQHSYLAAAQARRLVRAYGTDAALMLAEAKGSDDLGVDFGAGLSEIEVRWLMAHEFARRAEDIVWRRSKLGLRMSEDQIAALDHWMVETGSRDQAVSAAAE
ncbi:MAG: glycerol-3-phosphate dehydrogenase, partial [Pseudomonadota bacterium]